MGPNSGKTPRSQAAAASPEPDAEAAVAPASEVPEAPAEATEEQSDDTDPGVLVTVATLCCLGLAPIRPPPLCVNTIP